MEANPQEELLPQQETPPQQEKIRKLVDHLNRNRWWILLGALIGIAAFFFDIWPSKPKRFVYEVNSEILVTIDKSVNPNITVLYEDVSVNEIIVTRIKIWNDAKVEIRSDDIANSKPFIIKASEPDAILDVLLIDNTDPINEFAAAWNKEKGQIEISFDYVNPQDTATLQVLCGKEIEIYPELSIKGTTGESIKWMDLKTFEETKLRIGLWVAGIGGVIIMILWFTQGVRKKEKRGELFGDAAV
jgi:hypothetical protein